MKKRICLLSLILIGFFFLSFTAYSQSPACAIISSPTNGAIDVCSSSVTLNWTSGGGSPTGYKLYFGTDNPPTNIVNGTDLGDVLTYNPGSLSAGTTYYWRIDPYNANGTTTGCTIWSFTTGSSGTFTWNGNTSTSWHTASNWSGCTVPAWNSAVTIPDVTTDPVISASAEAGNLTIQSGGSLTISSNILHLHGNLTNNGTFTDNANRVMMIGANAQSVSGAITFYDLTIDNANGVTLNNATTVNGVLTLTNGTFTTNGNLTVNLNTGAIAGTGTGAISGNVTFSKTVNSDKYHMISCPLSGLTAAEWDDDVSITSQYKVLYKYIETSTDPDKLVGWEAIQSTSTSLEDMKGYALYFNGATIMDVTGSYTHSASYTSPTLTNTVSGTADSDGWNLMGNPYASALDWDAASGWTKTGLDNAIYFWDPVNNRYASYVNGVGANGGTKYIPSMQAFWVKVSAAGGTGSLAMNNNVRVTSTNPAIWKTAAHTNILKLTAGSGGYSDETIIRFTNDAEEIFDSHADAYKFMNEGNTPSLYTETEEEKYSINSLPIGSEELKIPVKLDPGFTGSYTFTAEETGSFENGDYIIFEDRLLGISQDLRANPSYTCQVTQGDTSGRFFISFKRESSESSSLNPKPSIFIRSSEQTVYINFSANSTQKANIVVYNSMGQEKFFIEDAEIPSGDFSILLPSAKAGIYIVKVHTPELIKTVKVFLNP